MNKADAFISIATLVIGIGALFGLVGVDKAVGLGVCVGGAALWAIWTTKGPK